MLTLENIELEKIVPIDVDSFGIVLTFDLEGIKKYFAIKLPKDYMNKSINELFTYSVQELEGEFGNT